MRKILWLIALLVPSILPASAVELDPGVSLSLANYRAEHVKDIHYSLHFNIPDARQERVRFKAEITFQWSGAGDLALDFQGECDKDLRINGRKRQANHAQEHIILGAKDLRKGRNTVVITGRSADKSLNRNGDYLYTLFVPDHARSVFPCFDQPSLKARFTLSLSLPNGWEAVSNAPIVAKKGIIRDKNGRQTVAFETSDLLPTYLFSFTAGRFERRETTRDGYAMEAFFRETDPQKTAQIDTVFAIAAHCLRWLETYTGMPQPFKKYAFVVLPGYQFGGMEHPGAIQFNDKRIFLGSNPTPDEELSRLDLIAHETAHLWFGDCVTMRWFNDVWTKEVFANFMAAKMTRENFPSINHDLNFLKAYHVPALATDRTNGTHPIQQPLANLNQAGLLYGNIIYDKAPIMMRMMEKLMSPQALRTGLQRYLRQFAYANATWDDLIAILDSVAPQANLPQFSEAWVKQKGLPTITMEVDSANNLVVRQADPYGRGLVWQQEFTVGLGNFVNGGWRTEDYTIDTLTVKLTEAQTVLPLSKRYAFIIPNYTGEGYGRFLAANDKQRRDMSVDWAWQKGTAQFAGMMTLYENWLAFPASTLEDIAALAAGFNLIRNPLTASTCLDYFALMVSYAPDTPRKNLEKMLLGIAHGS